MEKINSSLEVLREINNIYEISNESIDKLCSDIMGAKVCTPVIGKFSSGKSALINTLLRYNNRILREAITPETSIPTEIEYSDFEDKVTIIFNNGENKDLEIDDFREYKPDASEVNKAVLKLHNSVLAKFRDVMIVDMPGFESGYDVHNKAIDNYLPKSLAYIVVFPADDMVVRSSVGNALKELCLNDMPICIVITKCERKDANFETTFSKLKETLKRYIGEREVQYCYTSSLKGDAEDLEVFLKGIQDQSQVILENKYKKLVYALADNTENYLRTVLKNNELSESELDEQEDKLLKQMTSLNSRFAKEQDDFDKVVSECVEEIKGDVRQALDNEESTFVTMAMNNQDIKDHLNIVVRNAVTVSIKNRFIPRVEKYLNRVSNVLNDESLGDIQILFTFDADKMGIRLTTAIVAVVAGLLLNFPILGIITGIIIKIIGDKKRDEAKQEIRRKLQTEVFPQVILEVGNGLEQAITKQIKLINTSIEDELENQKEILNKAMSDLRGKINDEKANKDKLATEIRVDLERIGEIKDDLR